MEHITAVDVNPSLPYRAHYIARSSETGLLEPRMWSVVGYAALGTALWPVRIDEGTGRGVLVGSDVDPLREGFLGVLISGQPVSALGEEVDERARALIRADLQNDEEPFETDGDQDAGQR